jgi:hypothetical protein
MEGVVIYNALFTDFTQIGQYDGLLAPYHDLAPTPLSGHTAPTRTTTCHRGMLPAPHQSHVATKEEDPLILSNVSIIFDAPCLFLHHLPNVSLHFVALLCIFRN